CRPIQSLRPLRPLRSTPSLRALRPLRSIPSLRALRALRSIPSLRALRSLRSIRRCGVEVRKWLVGGGTSSYRDGVNEMAGLDRRALDRARRSRDPRFDGRFFIGVTSTGIYCRPICPVKGPKESNVIYFASAAAAAEAGFRPCLRCRPEASPGTPAWTGTSTTVSRALRLLEENGLSDSSVETLAERLGIGSRQLRRLFLKHLGATP